MATMGQNMSVITERCNRRHRPIHEVERDTHEMYRIKSIYSNVYTKTTKEAKFATNKQTNTDKSRTKQQPRLHFQTE